MLRGAVRPPFIEAAVGEEPLSGLSVLRGAVRPPFIEALRLCARAPLLRLASGGSPPPLH